METLRAAAAVKARKADVILNKKLLQLAQERKTAGRATSLDVTRAQVQFENEKLRLLVARNAQDQSTLNLLRAIGLPFSVTLELTDELKLVSLPDQSPEDALRVAKENRIELKAQARRERLAALSLATRKSYPKMASVKNGGGGGPFRFRNPKTGYHGCRGAGLE